ncbi:MAG TPA: metalloregulator ArsR/SmtB family transcription factor, partial [Desulfobacterales bacterium]|nr:metalloregulator ArsR/SmtB family transcription factor [Desulfobacterales bacterium]
VFTITYFVARSIGLGYEDAASTAIIAGSNHFEVAIAVAVTLFGVGSWAALATTVGVLTVVPIMLSLVWLCRRTRGFFSGGDQVKKSRGARGLFCRIPRDYRISKKTLEQVRHQIHAETKGILEVCGAVSHPIRLRILMALQVRELCVCVFVSLLRVEYPKLSYHLKLLKKAGLVDFPKEENFLIYRFTKFGRKLLKSVEG